MRAPHDRLRATIRLATPVAGKRRRCPSRQESEPTIRTAGGNQPVTSGGRAGPGMRRTSMARRLGTLENHSPRYCAWRAKAHSPAQFSMQDAGQARTPFTSPLGLPVLGVDVAETALSIAREKAAGRGIDAEFVVADALHLHRLGRVFETVLDCGLLHTFDSDERRDYVASLASVTARGGHLYVVCFSDVGPGTGPHPIGQEELRAAFARGSGWSVASVGPDRIQTRFDAQDAPAWLAKIERI